MKRLPTIPEVLADPCASYWLKRRSAMHRDIVDALNDAGFLLDPLMARLESTSPALLALLTNS